MNHSEPGRMAGCLGFLREKGVETGHPLHVSRNAAIIFDGLEELHSLGEKEREYLIYGSVLHDVGWSIAEKKHHKHSMDIILDNETLGFSGKEKEIIANIARYHRKSLPCDEHEQYSALDPGEKEIVLVNSSILRIADALDRMHMARINVSGCTINEDSVVLKCMADGVSKYEIAALEKKSDLFEKIFNRKVQLVCLIDTQKD